MGSRPDDDRGVLDELIGDGRPLLMLAAVMLFLSGVFAIFLSVRREFLPHDVAFLGMTAQASATSRTAASCDSCFTIAWPSAGP